MVAYQSKNNLSSGLRDRIFERDDKTCQYCGGFADAVDHIIPVSLGGDESEENLVACCKTDNSLAHNRTFKSFKEKKNFILRMRKKRGKKITFKEEFKYKRNCKLPSCLKPFETNREWQFFHHPDCQKKWQRLLRRSHEETIVELELLKEDMKKVKRKLGMK